MIVVGLKEILIEKVYIYLCHCIGYYKARKTFFNTHDTHFNNILYNLIQFYSNYLKQVDKFT